MKKLLLIGLIIAFAAVAKGGLLDLDVGITVKFGISLDVMSAIGKEYFMKVPMNQSQAISQNWTQTDGCSCSGSTDYDALVPYCMKGNNLCGLYEKNSGGILGMQIGVLKKNLTAALDMNALGWCDCTIEGETMLVTKHFLASPEFLANSASTYNSSVVLQQDAVWLTGYNGKLMEVPANTTSLTTDTKWTKQNYVIWMGQHFYFDMSNTTQCTSSGLFPYFLLGHNDRTVGTAVMIPGKMERDENALDCFESPTKAAVKFIVNDGPECLYNMAESPGIITLHMYYTATPWKILWG